VSGEVYFTREFGAWAATLLTDEDRYAEMRALVDALVADVLAPKGPQVVPDAVGSPVIELRPRGKGASMRVFYALDPLRDAVLLLGGDKTEAGKGKGRGGKGTAWSLRMFAESARIFGDYVLALGHRRREATHIANLPRPVVDEQSLDRQVARATGWAITEVRRMMRPGGPLDPNSADGEDRILDLIYSKPKLDGLSLLRALRRAQRRALSGLDGLDGPPRNVVETSIPGWHLTIRRVVRGVYNVTAREKRKQNRDRAAHLGGEVNFNVTAESFEAARDKAEERLFLLAPRG
jgi:hypothetical protein